MVSGNNVHKTHNRNLLQIVKVKSENVFMTPRFKMWQKAKLKWCDFNRLFTAFEFY